MMQGDPNMPKIAGNELDELKVDILKHAYISEAEWIRERRAREYQIFAWINSVFMLIIGALIVVNPTNKNILRVDFVQRNHSVDGNTYLRCNLGQVVRLVLLI